MAATVFVVAALALYTILIQAYNMVALARYRDAGRAVLRAYADQFERLQAQDASPTDGKVYTRWLFAPNYADGAHPKGTGDGLCTLERLSDMPGYDTVHDNNSGSGKIALGGPEPDNTDPNASTNALLGGAMITHTVEVISFDQFDANVNGQTVPEASLGTSHTYHGGALYLGTFYITYTVNNKPVTQYLCVLRNTK